MRVIKTIAPELFEVQFKMEPIVIRVTNFNEEAASVFHQSINEAQNTGQPIIPIVVDSYGGDPYSLISMLSCIKNCPLPVATIVTGKAMSCGSFFAAFGTPGYRYANPMATFMIHEVSADSEFQKNEELKASVKQIDSLNSLLFEELNLSAGQNKNYFQNLLHSVKNADYYMSANEALELGLIDHLHIPTFDYHTSVTYKFDNKVY